MIICCRRSPSTTSSTAGRPRFCGLASELRPSGVPWLEVVEQLDEEKIQARQEAELRRSAFERNLLKTVPEREIRVRRLTAQLLEFHHRKKSRSGGHCLTGRAVPLMN